MSTASKGWEETIIKSVGEEGEEVDARISVPAMPSPYVVAFLFAACREIHRVGGHVLDRAVLELFAWELLDKVSLYCWFPLNCFRAYHKLAQEPMAGI